MSNPITWQTINAPDLTAAGTLMRQASDNFNQAFTGLSGIAKQQRDLNIASQNKQELDNYNQARAQLLKETPDLESLSTFDPSAITNNPNIAPEYKDKLLSAYEDRKNTLIKQTADQTQIDSAKQNILESKAKIAKMDKDTEADTLLKGAQTQNTLASAGETQTKNTINQLKLSELLDTKKSMDEYTQTQQQLDNKLFNKEISFDTYVSTLKESIAGMNLPADKKQELLKNAFGYIDQLKHLDSSQEAQVKALQDSYVENYRNSNDTSQIESDINQAQSIIKNKETMDTTIAGMTNVAKNQAEVIKEFGENASDAYKLINSRSLDKDIMDSFKDSLKVSLKETYPNLSNKEILAKVKEASKNGVLQQYKYFAILGTKDTYFLSTLGKWWSTSGSPLDEKVYKNRVLDVMVQNFLNNQEVNNANKVLSERTSELNRQNAEMQQAKQQILYSYLNFKGDSYQLGSNKSKDGREGK